VTLNTALLAMAAALAHAKQQDFDKMMPSLDGEGRLRRRLHRGQEQRIEGI